MAWAPDYVSVEEANAYLRLTDEVDNDELALIVSTTSRAIDRRCNRQFGQVDEAEERTYTARWSRTLQRWVVEIDDLAVTTDLVVTVDGAATTDYVLTPRNAIPDGKVWTTIIFGSDTSLADDEVSIVAIWGWPAVPSNIKAAGRIQVNRFLSRRDSPYGVVGSPADGSELRLLAKLDPDVELMVAGSGFVRVWGAK